MIETEKAARLAIVSAHRSPAALRRAVWSSPVFEQIAVSRRVQVLKVRLAAGGAQ
jgi:hypothetical protein